MLIADGIISPLTLKQVVSWLKFHISMHSTLTALFGNMPFSLTVVWLNSSPMRSATAAQTAKSYQGAVF